MVHTYDAQIILGAPQRWTDHPPARARRNARHLCRRRHGRGLRLRPGHSR